MCSVSYLSLSLSPGTFPTSPALKWWSQDPTLDILTPSSVFFPTQQSPLVREQKSSCPQPVVVTEDINGNPERMTLFFPEGRSLPTVQYSSQRDGDIQVSILEDL